MSKKKFARQKWIKELDVSNMVHKITNNDVEDWKAQALKTALEEIKETDTTPGQNKKVKEYSVGDLVYKYIKESNIVGKSWRSFLQKVHENFAFRYAIHVKETYFIVGNDKAIWLKALAMAGMRAIVFIKWCADQNEKHPELGKCAWCVEHTSYVFQGDLFRTVMGKVIKTVVKKTKLDINPEINILMDLVQKLIKS